MATSLSSRFSPSNSRARPLLRFYSSWSPPSALLYRGFRPLPARGKSRKRGGRRGASVHEMVCASVDPLQSVEAASSALSQGYPHLTDRIEGMLYTLADAAVSMQLDATTADSAAQAQSSDWLSGLTNVLESFLKVLKQGFEALHVPYAYGFAIIALTIIVKAATFPLTKQQVESTLAMQNLAPKVKAIQERYSGDKERIQLETARLYKQAGVNPLAGCLPTLATIPVFIGLYRALSNVANEGLLTEGFFWVPSLAGPTTIASRQNGGGIAWLFPFVDGHPPLGWNDTIAYLLLPVLLIISQYVAMQIMQTPQATDPSQKNTQAILKFLPLMIGYFSLSVPSGLSLYWLTNNILSTAQQVWLRKLGVAKPPVSRDRTDIITAGKAQRSTSALTIDVKETKRGERLKQLKMKEGQRKAEHGLSEVKKHGAEVAANTASSLLHDENERNQEDVGTVDFSPAKDSLEEIYKRNGAGLGSSVSKRSKRSKRKRAV